MRYTPTVRHSLLPPSILLLAFAAAGCEADKGSMLLPSDASISLVSSAPLVVVNSTVEVTVQATDGAGNPVPDGTEILLTASRGEFGSPKVRTRDGRATISYQAAPDPGPVELLATSDEVQAQMVLPTASAPVGQVILGSSQAAVPYGGGQVDLTATVLSPSGERVMGAPVVFLTNSGSFSPAGAVTTNEQGRASAKLTTKQATQARARVHTIESDPVSIQMEDRVGLAVVANPSSTLVGQSVQFTITPDDLNREGTMTLNYGDGQVQPLGAGKGVRTAAYTYGTVGSFQVTATFKSLLGTEAKATTQVVVSGFTTTPNPSFTDDPNLPFSLRDVTWLHADVSGWAVTSKITSIDIDPNTICIDHTKSGRWPVNNGGEGNPWVFAKIGGRWYAATYEWLRSGQVCKNISGGGPDGIGPHTKKPPLESWAPRKGELVGFMVSAFARDSTRTVLERSNIVMVNWPY